MKLAQTAENIIAIRNKYRYDIEGFGRDICKFYEPCEWQKKLAKSVMENQFTVVTSGQGTGKSSYSSVIILWWLLMCADRIVILTGSSESGLMRTMRPALLSVLHNSLVSGWFEGNTEELRLIGSKNKLHYVLWSINAPERAQGVHLPPGYCDDGGILVWNDEASSLPNVIYESLLLSMDNDNCRMVMTGNPLKLDGPFYEATKIPSWHWIKVNAENIAYTNKAIHINLENTYGRDSNIYKVRVLGEFPNESDDRWFRDGNTKFPVSNTLSCVKDHLGYFKVAGIDVGEEGKDPSALVIRRAGVIEYLRLFKEPNHIRLKDRISEILISTGVEYVAIDANGPGYGFCQIFACDLRFKVIKFKGSYKAAQEDAYSNMRTECYGNLHKLVADLKVQSGVSHEMVSMLRSDLKAQQVYLNSKGIYALVDKELIKKELGHSPDLGDALSFTYCNFLLGKTLELSKVKKIIIPETNAASMNAVDQMIKERKSMYMGEINYSGGNYSGW
jgi:hypothetical protein